MRRHAYPKRMICILMNGIRWCGFESHFVHLIFYYFMNMLFFIFMNVLFYFIFFFYIVLYFYLSSVFLFLFIHHILEFSTIKFRRPSGQRLVSVSELESKPVL